MMRLVGLVLAGLVLLGFATGGWSGYASVAAETHPASSVENVSISTEHDFDFLPPKVTVTAGDTVDLVVTQGDVLPHTFTLSSVANYTIPSDTTTAGLYAFFNAHPPLDGVNLSLPGTPGAQAFANFTAPAVGTYEFVCLIPGHFQEGMFGFLYSSNQTSPSSGPSSTALLLTPLELGAIGGAAVVIVAAVLIARRRSGGKRPQAPGPG